jgi:hypothetical protein
MRIYPAVLIGLFVASPARAAEPDWFSSLYSGDGIELRGDERVFRLYALLNASGYDAAPVARRLPFPKLQLHPVRASVREKLAAEPSAAELRKQADAYFDAHPVALEKYLAQTLGAKSPGLEGFSALVEKAATAWKLEELLASVQSEYRKAARGYLAAVDAPMGRARKLLKLPDSGPHSLVVVNLLGAQNEVRGVMGERELVLVVGPTEGGPNIEGLVREYARLHVGDAVAKKAAAWGGGAGLLRDAQAAGAQENTPAEYAQALFSRALALKAMEAGDPAYEAAAAQGYFGLKEIGRGFDDSRPLEAWALEALAKAETRKPARSR